MNIIQEPFGGHVTSSIIGYISNFKNLIVVFDGFIKLKVYLGKNKTCFCCHHFAPFTNLFWPMDFTKNSAESWPSVQPRRKRRTVAKEEETKILPGGIAWDSGKISLWQLIEAAMVRAVPFRLFSLLVLVFWRKHVWECLLIRWDVMICLKWGTPKEPMV